MKWFLRTFGTLNTKVQVLEMILMLERTISNISNGIQSILIINRRIDV